MYHTRHLIICLSVMWNRSCISSTGKFILRAPHLRRNAPNLRLTRSRPTFAAKARETAEIDCSPIIMTLYSFLKEPFERKAFVDRNAARTPRRLRSAAATQMGTESTGSRQTQIVSSGTKLLLFPSCLHNRSNSSSVEVYTPSFGVYASVSVHAGTRAITRGADMGQSNPLTGLSTQPNLLRSP